ncbi:unnamed protein product [Prunus brigantina]
MDYERPVLETEPNVDQVDSEIKVMSVMPNVFMPANKAMYCYHNAFRGKRLRYTTITEQEDETPLEDTLIDLYYWSCYSNLEANAADDIDMTEDSFIDDAELDEYFKVDNSAIKHEGFFVNRGKLERMKKSTDSKTILDPSLLKVSEGDAAALQAEVKAIHKQNAGVLLSKDPIAGNNDSRKLNEGELISDDHDAAVKSSEIISDEGASWDEENW